MNKLVLVMTLFVAGCGGGPVMPPVVDMHGVEQAKYNDDVADCYHTSLAGFHLGNPMTKCMQAKGYKILVGY